MVMVLAPPVMRCFSDVARGGSGDAREIDAPVIFEMLILDGRDRVVEDPRGLLEGHEDAALQGEAADHLAVIGINFRDYRGPVGFEGANFGEVARVDEEKAAGRADGHGAQQQESERDAVNEFEAAQAQGYWGKA